VTEASGQAASPSLNPLAEAKSDSLEELFSRDPMGFTTQDLDRVIMEFRRQREKWTLAEAKGAKAPKQPKAAEGKKTLTLDDLGL